MAKPLKKPQKPEPTIKKVENDTLLEFLAKLKQHNLSESDAATTAKYYYNQPSLETLTAAQFDSLFQRLLDRVEKTEATVLPISTEVHVEAQPIIETPIEAPLIVVEVAEEIAVQEVEPAEVAAPESAEISEVAAVSAEEPEVEAAAVETPAEIVAPEVVATPEVVEEVKTPEPVIEVAPAVSEVIAPEVVAPVAAVVAEAPKAVEAAPEAPVAAPVVAAPVQAPEPAQEAKSEPTPEPEKEAAPATPEIMEARYWRKNGWIAKVIKNEEDDGWAVEICKEGVSDPVLISPWVMGRDKKNPKPFDAPSFNTFVKTASEVIRRAEQQRDRALKKMVNSCWDGIWYKIVLQIIPDEFDPHAILSATGPDGDTISKIRVAPNYKLTQSTADKWVRGGFKEM